MDCADGGLLRCQTCIVDLHACHPLHRLEVLYLSCNNFGKKRLIFSQRWNGHFFEKSSLYQAGLHIPLGHGGVKCPCASSEFSLFSIIDLSGIHQVAINFCDCCENGIIPRHVQLLRAGWFPATFNCPKTAFTFHCLDFYHELTLQGKVNAYDFCRTLLHITDNLDFKSTSVCIFPQSWDIF